jgi:hypothetical protein
LLESEGVLNVRRASVPCRRLYGSGSRAAENTIHAINKMVKKSELCARYSVSQRTVENWMSSGILPYCKPSYGIVRFDIEACDKALERFQRNIIAVGN